MRTIDRKSLRAPAFFLTVFFWLSFFSLPAFAEGGQVPQPRFFIAAAVGYFYPQQGTFRNIYNKPAWPVELQLGWNLNRKMSVLGAARYLETSGNTVLLAAQRPEETYALRWRMVTMRLGMNYWLWPSRFTPFLGAGVSYSFYKEQWLDVPQETQSQKAGFFVQAGGRYRLGRRWHALAQLEYSSVPAGSGAQGKVNLGGLNLSLGLMAGIF
jgi:opacity protein-like surface antigen